MPMVARGLLLILLSTITIGKIAPNMPSIILQRFKCCQMLANDVKRAHKGFFNSIIQTIQQKFEHLLQLEQGSVDF